MSKSAPTGPSRDSVTTIREDGSHNFLHPADTRGRFTLARRISAWGLIVFYLALPWFKVGGYPAVFLDIAHRRFHLFGWTLATQDLWLIFFLFSGLGFTLFFVTALLGRAWCGWACPQTVFLEHVYRRIERWIEGDAHRRRQLDAAPAGFLKLGKRALKHFLYALVSLAITHLFIAYFISIPELWSMMRANPRENWSIFAFVFIAAGTLYLNFAWFREQLCIVICPYGRLQSALVDEHSLVIGYDARRGEPRNKLGTPDSGDCVACNRCVQVCPTGIDIRQGQQIECIGCTACIDACDEVMVRVNRPEGLIRYDSLSGFAGGATRWFRPRTAFYAVLFLIGVAVAAWALSSVHAANFSITRIVGAPYFVDADAVRNQFFVRIINKRPEPVLFQVSLAGAHPVTQNGLLAPVEVPAMGEEIHPLVLIVPRDRYEGPFTLQVSLADDRHSLALHREIEFLGPDPRLLQEDPDEKAGPR